MSVLSDRLVGYFHHFCPACGHLHPIPKGRWTFNGDMAKPTFTPSFLQNGLRIKTENGKWTGKYHRDADGKPLDGRCHYFITDGKIQFLPDSWHQRSDIVAMPDVPAHLDESKGD